MQESTITFHLNEEFEDMGIDGKPFKAIVTRDGNIFVQKSSSEGKEIVVTRTFTQEGMQVLAEINGVTSTRFYKRVEKEDESGSADFD